MSAFIFSIKIKINVALAYRLEVISGIISNFIILISSVFFWKAAYSNASVVASVNAEQMITYSVITTLLGVLLKCNVGDVLGDKIRMGNVALDILKPVNIYAMYFAQDLGELINSLCVNVLPLLLFSLIFIRFSLPPSFTAFILFVISTTLAYLILWLISAIVGLLTFWAMNIGPLGFIKDAIIRILSGSIIPIWFFPESFQNVINFTPFIYTYQLAAGIYIGKLNNLQAIQGNLIQIIWIGILYLIFYFLKNKSIKKVMVQGG